MTSAKKLDHEHQESHQVAEIKATNLAPEDRKYLEKHRSELSHSTLRAHWINKPSEKAEHDGQTLATRQHAVIKAWAEARKAKPATIEGTRHGDQLGVLRFNFPGFAAAKNTNLRDVDWDEWFKSFDAADLVFLFQDKMKDGQQSNFFHLDSPRREHD